MRKIAKIVGISLVLGALFVGCADTGGKDEYFGAPTNSAVQTSFADEVYIWESFVFSTNRVEKTR